MFTIIMIIFIWAIVMIAVHEPETRLQSYTMKAVKSDEIKRTTRPPCPPGKTEFL